MKWAPPGREDVEDELTSVVVNGKDILEMRGAYLDMSSDGGSRLQFGQETLFVNASIMDVRYNPRNAPWIIDLDLPRCCTIQDVGLQQDQRDQPGDQSVSEGSEAPRR